MAFITFMYRIGNNTKTYNGKYESDYISDDHSGLDKVVKYSLINGINKYREKNNKSKLTTRIRIGVMSMSNDRYIPTYSTDNEITFFDFYYTEHNYKSKTYINGKIIE